MTGGRRTQSLSAQLVAFERAQAEFVAGTPGAADSLRRLARAIRQSAADSTQSRVAAAAAALETATDGDVARLAAEIVSAAREADTEPTSADGATILVVDDDTSLHAIFTRALAGPGRFVVCAGTIADAEEALARRTASVVLLDLVLPDGDGRNFLVRLRESPATATVPVLVMSALRSAQVRSECYALGCDAYLDKPVDIHAVTTTVSTLLERAARTDRPAPQQSRAVLLAEDDPVIAALVQHRLSRDGFDVVHIPNGKDALERAGRERFALAILDVNMPGMSGFALLEKLREQPTLSALPIMMLTAMGNEADIARALELGANDYVVKPFSPVELLARVRRLAPHA